jgi:excisionase family DNA binding protein
MDPCQHKMLWTSREVAEWLGVTTRTVCLWAELGELPALRVGRQWRFRPDTLDGWLRQKANSIANSSPPR